MSEFNKEFISNCTSVEKLKKIEKELIEANLKLQELYLIDIIQLNLESLDLIEKRINFLEKDEIKDFDEIIRQTNSIEDLSEFISDLEILEEKFIELASTQTDDELATKQVCLASNLRTHISSAKAKREKLSLRERYLAQHSFNLKMINEQLDKLKNSDDIETIINLISRKEEAEKILNL